MSDVDMRDHDALDERLTTVFKEQRGQVLVNHFSPLVDTEPLEWIWNLSDRFEHHALPLPVIRSVTADLAWAARHAARPYPDEAEWEAALAAAPPNTMRPLVVAYVLGQRLRFDFKLERLRSWSRRWLDLFTDDALILGLAAFAELGLKDSEGFEFFKRSTQSPNADARSRHVCLAAMWFADHIEDQPKILLELSSEMISKGEVNSDVYYRQALGLRKLGRYKEALQAIDRAMDKREVGDLEVYQNYARERELIGTTVAINEQVQKVTSDISDRLDARLEEQIQAASVELQKRVDNAQRVMADSLLRIIEILGLFVAIVGFLIGTGAVVLKAETFGELAIAVTLGLVSSVAFFLLLRLVMSVRRS
jgi:hypothetical protein